MSRRRLDALLESLESTIGRISWDPADTPWAGYGDQTSYSSSALADKKRLVAECLSSVSVESVWDVGGNTGDFSRIAATGDVPVVSIDSDPGAVGSELSPHGHACANRTSFPIVADITSPSPALGWDNREVASLTSRGPAGLVMALALIHHVAIGNNTGFDRPGSVSSRRSDRYS